LRDCAELLRRAGFSAYITRQNPSDIREGSAVRRREGILTLVVDFGGKLGAYHLENPSRDCVSVVQRALVARQDKADWAELEAIIDKGEAAGVAVCLADSLRAGNCRPGSESFARQHGLDSRAHYSAAELLAVANGSTRFVRAAVVSAIRRERKELAAGVCLLADHRA
jgi:hypothetical protein